MLRYIDVIHKQAFTVYIKIVKSIKFSDIQCEPCLTFDPVLLLSCNMVINTLSKSYQSVLHRRVSIDLDLNFYVYQNKLTTTFLHLVSPPLTF